ncbi:hypothetical protein NDU88_004659 [Pleurodeles waltl]|uniref:Uncharacterized protein n=1 Tax=Pleurodeles waltl TaxID=8319 RepID=A0AAV7W9M0_PLEWA|nr:hypothetical protein NDU88_004659 [Pleurodeles waltl]
MLLPSSLPQGVEVADRGGRGTTSLPWAHSPAARVQVASCREHSAAVLHNPLQQRAAERHALVVGTWIRAAYGRADLDAKVELPCIDPGAFFLRAAQHVSVWDAECTAVKYSVFIDCR